MDHPRITGRPLQRTKQRSVDRLSDKENTRFVFFNTFFYMFNTRLWSTEKRRPSPTPHPHHTLHNTEALSLTTSVPLSRSEHTSQSWTESTWKIAIYHFLTNILHSKRKMSQTMIRSANWSQKWCVCQTIMGLVCIQLLQSSSCPTMRICIYGKLKPG